MYQITRPKIKCEELSRPKNFTQFGLTSQKLRNFFAGRHRQTNGSENNAFFHKSKVVRDILKSDFDFMH